MRIDLIGSAAPLALALALAGPAVAAAQAVPDSAAIYQREVFQYARSGRPDPFRSLVRDRALGIRMEDLTVRGIMYHPDPSRSVAVLTRAGVERPLRARVGDQIGGVRIVAIQPRRVEVLLEELGVVRRGTLELKPAPKKGGST